MTETSPLTVRLNAADNVVVAHGDIPAGADIPGEGVAAAEPIPAGHKIATAPIAEGEPVRKYDQIIGCGMASGEDGHAILQRVLWGYARHPNKAGGLTTILEKSLGAAAKGGTTNLTGVYKYAEPVTGKGFTFMDTPGYDPASITGQVAGGANLVCFTTGRGSAFGFKPAPSVKLATNTPMFERLEEDMDLNCGEILDKGVSVEETRSEALGLGDNEFVPWLVGAVM